MTKSKECFIINLAKEKLLSIMNYILTANLQLKNTSLTTNQVEYMITQALHTINKNIKYSTYQGEFKLTLPKTIKANQFFADLGNKLNCNVFYSKIK